MSLERVVGQALEASRVKEQVLSRQAREISLAAGLLLEAARSERDVHLLGEGTLVPQARYLARVFHQAGSGDQIVGARLLADESAGSEGYSRAVQAFVSMGEILLVLAAEPTPRLQRALEAARGRDVRTLGLLGMGAQPLVSEFEVAILVPSPHPFVIAETLLSVGHVLQGLVLAGLERLSGSGSTSSSRFGAGSSSGTGRALQASTPPPHPPPILAPRPTRSLGRLIDSDTDPRAESTPDASSEAALLKSAVESGYAPPTDPHGRSRRAMPNTVRFRCGACDDVISIEARYAGRRGQCPHCGSEFMIPQPDPHATVPPRAALISSSGGARRTGRRRRRGRSSAKERRRSPRFPVKDALVRLSRSGFPEAQGTYLEPQSLDDLSLTGLRFVGRSREFKVGEVYFLAIDFPAFPRPVLFKAEIRRVSRLRGQDGFGIGVRFLEYVGDAESKVQRLLESDTLRQVRRR